MSQFKFPKNPTPGMEISDKYGTIWKYYAETRNWSTIGTLKEIPIVNEKENGLITPEIYNKIKQVNNIQKTPGLKLKPGTKAYWYYFRSSNKTIRFKSETEERLRIEVDLGRVYQLLYKVGHCPGKTGDDGLKGDAGKDGIQAPDELCFAPIRYDGKKLDFAMYVPVPLTCESDILLPNGHVPEISVRLYEIRRPWTEVTNDDVCEKQTAVMPQYLKDNQDELQKFKKQAADCGTEFSPVIKSIPVGWKIQSLWSLDIQIDPTGEKETVIKDAAPYIDIAATKNSIVFNKESSIVCGSVFLTENAPQPFKSTNWLEVNPIYSGWCIKARQKGPDGLPGEDADCRVSIKTLEMTDQAVVATCPIVNVRFDSSTKTLFTKCADIVGEYCAEKIVLLPSSDLIADKPIFQSNYAGVETTLEECKSITNTTLSVPEVTKPRLNLIKWQPVGGCSVTRYFSSIKYDWNSLLQDPDKYPFTIKQPQQVTEDNCCKEDFFYCGNVQRGTCNENSQNI